MTSRGTAPAFVVVDVRCRIRYVSAAEGEGEGELSRIIVNRAKLQPEVETFIHGLSTERGDSLPPVRAAILSDSRILRVVRVVGGEGTMFILSVEEDHNSNSLLRAARRHQLTRRETEVLSLILDGSSAGEIAEMLALSEHTVQGYFKRLLFKTGARNRVSMVASMFDWDPQMRQAKPIAEVPSRRERAALREPLVEQTA